MALPGRARALALAVAAALLAAAAAQLDGEAGPTDMPIGVVPSPPPAGGSPSGSDRFGPVDMGGSGPGGEMSGAGIGMAPADQHFFPMPGDGVDPGIVMHEDLRIDVGKPSGQPVKVIVANVTKPKGFVQIFTAQDPVNATQRVAVMSQRNKCTLATNGGAQNGIKPGEKGYRVETLSYPDWEYGRSVCNGVTVVNGKVLCAGLKHRRDIGFGVTNDGKWAWGKFSGDEVANMKFFRTGHDYQLRSEFLVDNYEIVHERCPGQEVDCGELISARTGVALTENNQFLMVTIDGSSGEFDDHESGVTLDQFARVMQQLGAKYAINMDGGGSTTMVATRSFPAIGKPNVKVLNDPSDCRSLGAQAVGVYDTSDIQEEPWWAQAAMNLAEMGPNGVCSRKRPDLICIGDDTETHTVPAPPAGGILNGCGHDVLETHMVGNQLNFCKHAYQNLVEHSFDTDAREAYEDALAAVADYKARLYIACQQQTMAPYYMPKHASTCGGQNDAEDAFWHVALTALLARRVLHEGSLGGRGGAGGYAQQYMDAGEDKLVTGWDVSDVKACAGNKDTCVSAATNVVNHAVGVRVWEEAWGPYQKCRNVWRWRKNRLRRVTVCTDKFYRPSKEKLARRAFLAVCDGWKKGNLADMTVGNNFNANAYGGKAYFRFGSKPDALLCKQVQSLEDQEDAQLSGSMSGAEMDAGVVGFFAGLAVACVGVALAARYYVQKRPAAAKSEAPVDEEELPALGGVAGAHKTSADKMSSVNPIYAEP